MSDATEGQVAEKSAFFQRVARAGGAGASADPSAARQSIPSISQIETGRAAFPPSSGLVDVANTAVAAIPSTSANVAPESSGDDGEIRQFPLQDVQEACLLRYFVEEISRWV